MLRVISTFSLLASQPHAEAISPWRDPDRSRLKKQEGTARTSKRQSPQHTLAHSHRTLSTNQTPRACRASPLYTADVAGPCPARIRGHIAHGSRRVARPQSTAPPSLIRRRACMHARDRGACRRPGRAVPRWPPNGPRSPLHTARAALTLFGEAASHSSHHIPCP